MPKPQHVHELYIRTTPERLWDALTTPELASACFPTGAAVIGEVLEAEPPWRLVTAFSLAGDPEAAAEVPSRVTWEIYAAGELCRLRLTHSDFGGLSRTWAATAGFWPPVISGLKTLLETGEPLGPVDLPPLEGDAVDLDAEWHRDLGIDTNQEVWGLLGRLDRTPAADEAMVRAAYASAYHWSRAARRTEANEARAEWMLSHVHAVLGRADMAQHHAQRCLAVVEAAGLDDFDLAYAHEALARAAAADGRLDDAERHRAAAAAVPIADDEDRKIFIDDLAASPWFGLAATG